MPQHTSGPRVAVLVAAVAAALAVAAPAVAATAPAQVFAPNPVADLGIQTLTDQKDADFFSADPVLRRAYHRVTLTDLDVAHAQRHVRHRQERDGGRRREHGVGLHLHARPGPVRAGDGLLLDHPGTAVHPEPGLRRRAAGRQPPSGGLRINQFGGDNSFFRDTKTDITLGKGGVDDAEDAEVIVHEYGHSVQDDQVPGFGTSPDAGAIGEGFGDYLAVAVVGGRPRRRTSRVSPTGTPRPTP